MNVIIHQNPKEYLAEYAHVRAALVAEGSSVRKWARDHGVDYQLVLRSLKGKSYGRQAIELRVRILTEVLSKAA